MEVDMNMTEEDEEDYDNYGCDNEDLELTRSKTVIVPESLLEGIQLSVCTNVLIVSTYSSYPIQVRVTTLNTRLLSIPYSS